MKIYAMERDKKIKLAKNIKFKLTTVRNFKATINLFNFLSLKKRKAAINL